MLRRSLLVALALGAVLGGAHAAESEEVRAVSGFSALVVTGPVDVVLKAGDTERVTLRADEKALPLIDVAVADGKLVVGLKPHSAALRTGRMVATVEFRELNSIAIRGSGDVRANRLKAQVLEITIRGSGDVLVDEADVGALAIAIFGSGDVRIAAGRADNLGLSIDGSGDVLADGLTARQVAVRVRGSGDARVHATEVLSVDVGGSGDVRYKGAPQLTQKVRGSGSVAPLK